MRYLLLILLVLSCSSARQVRENKVEKFRMELREDIKKNRVLFEKEYAIEIQWYMKAADDLTEMYRLRLEGEAIIR